MIGKGDSLPDLILEDQNGKSISLNNFKGMPLVVYFYPKNETPGCIAEACAFRDQYEDFKEAGAEVIGISGDSTSSHNRFSKNRRLNFILLSDKNRKAEKAFGVPRNLFGFLPGRVTFVANKEGEIIHTFNSGINPIQHVSEALKAIQLINEK